MAFAALKPVAVAIDQDRITITVASSGGSRFFVETDTRQP
jgi:hypothetical protein